MYVNEIFQSIDGEGSRAGYLATFIRLCGCNLRCSYCDTAYAFSNKGAREMSPEEIVAEVDKISIGRMVTLTGGEPLIHPWVYDLIEELIAHGYFVNVETNGSVVPMRKSNPGHLMYTMDVKCPSSGESEHMSLEAFCTMRLGDVVKFVVGSQEDLDFARDFLKKYPTNAQIFLSPVFGKIEPREIVEYMQENEMAQCRIQLQLHKFIWDPKQRGV